MLRAANLLLKFLLELAALTALAYWGLTIAQGLLGALIGIAAASTMIGLWGRFAAPKSRHRLPRALRVPFELTVFALAALALLDAGQTRLGLTLALLALANSALLLRRPRAALKR
jgi:hypothetical protein